MSRSRIVFASGWFVSSCQRSSHQRKEKDRGLCVSSLPRDARQEDETDLWTKRQRAEDRREFKAVEKKLNESCFGFLFHGSAGCLRTTNPILQMRNYNSKREDLEEEDQGEDERNVIL